MKQGRIQKFKNNWMRWLKRGWWYIYDFLVFHPFSLKIGRTHARRTGPQSALKIVKTVVENINKIGAKIFSFNQCVTKFSRWMAGKSTWMARKIILLWIFHHFKNLSNYMYWCKRSLSWSFNRSDASAENRISFYLYFHLSHGFEHAYDSSHL